MNFIRGIQNTRVFHAAEQTVKGVSTAIENISPKAFYPLVMNAPASDVTSSVWTSKGMAQHIPGDIHILDSAKKKLKYSGRCVVCVGFKIDDHTGVAIDPSMDDKAPPKK